LFQPTSTSTGKTSKPGNQPEASGAKADEVDTRKPKPKVSTCLVQRADAQDTIFYFLFFFITDIKKAICFSWCVIVEHVLYV